MGEKELNLAIAELREALGEKNVLTDDFIRASYNHDISMYCYHYTIPGAVVTPESTEQVQAVVKIANKNRIPVVTVGGNTFGNGNVESNGGIMVDLSKMNKILEIDRENMTFTVEAGANVHSVNDDLKKSGCTYPTYPLCFGPMTFGSEVAKNSGGEVGSMFGHVAKRVIGLQAVTGAGDVICTGSSNVIKNTPHFIQSSLCDLTGLFVGSECSLGIITQVTMQMQLIPPYTDGCDVKFPHTYEGFDAAVRYVQALKNYKGMCCNAHILDCYSGWLDMRYFTQNWDISPEAEETALPQNGTVVLVEFEGYASKEECDLKMAEAMKLAEKFGGVPSGNFMSEIFFKAEHGDVKLTEVVYAGGYAGTMIMTNTPYSAMTDLYKEWHKNLDELGLPKAWSSMIIACGDDCCIPFYYPWHPLRENSEENEWNENLEKWKLLVDRTYKSALKTGSVPYAVSRNWRPYLLDQLEPGYRKYMNLVKQAFDPNNIMNPGVGVFGEVE